MAPDAPRRRGCAPFAPALEALERDALHAAELLEVRVALGLRQGIARHLIATAPDYLRQHALCEARLEVAHKEAGLDLYRALGYVVAWETRLYVLQCK